MTGIHVSIVYKLRQALGLDRPGTPVKVVEIYQMLGEVAPDLQAALGVDAVSLHGTGTMFGFPQTEFKEWQLADGTPVLVPKDFNTQYEPNGDLLQWPCNDRSVPPSGRMPAGGHFFDAIIRQEPLDEAKLNPADNTEEFQPVPDSELEHYRRLAERLATTTDKAAVLHLRRADLWRHRAGARSRFMPRPKGIRDVEEWYVSTASRPDYIKAVFERAGGGGHPEPRAPACGHRRPRGHHADQRHRLRHAERPVPERRQVSRPVPALPETRQRLDSPAHEVEDVHALLRRRRSRC